MFIKFNYLFLFFIWISQHLAFFVTKSGRGAASSPPLGTRLHVETFFRTFRALLVQGDDSHFTKYFGGTIIASDDSTPLILSSCIQSQSYLPRAISYRYGRVMSSHGLGHVWLRDILRFHAHLPGSLFASKLTKSERFVIDFEGDDDDEREASHGEAVLREESKVGSRYASSTRP